MATLGFRDAIAYGIDSYVLQTIRIGRLISYRLYAQPVAPGAFSTSRASRIVTEIIQPGDSRLASLDLAKEAIDFRFGQDATCVAAVADGSLIGAIWFVDGAYIEDEVRCTYKSTHFDNAVWDFGVHVDPKYRMSPIFARLWAATSEVMAERGAKWTLSRISAYNPQSVRSHERMGAKCVGKVRFLNLFGLQIMWGNVPPYVHLSLPSQSGPVLRVGANNE